ncbi:hypothetical protein F8E02_04050 [Methanoculleus sp. Wushi-C6]|uniref:Polysaccharide pyruvyl transferase domain-containing protein n=1 Tax=Methanoculleus caldifontis TaxID=2651577 RepID=A0ABU3WZH9_9EURY|nr:polysaccharide pyruvyl transferase family protein [Methanoculleus sp. Wushi-C6]MDV2481194.1 hypothetical protein [Methanoculleus sp. Wushi-C6]
MKSPIGEVTQDENLETQKASGYMYYIIYSTVNIIITLPIRENFKKTKYLTSDAHYLQSMLRALILNVGFKNKGNEALIASTKDIIWRYIKNVEFLNMGAAKDPDNQIILQPARNPMRSPYPWLYLFECLIIKTLRRCGLQIGVPKKSKLRVLDEIDVVINSGGDQLSGEKTPGSSFLNIIYALLLDKPVVLFAESLGYYKSPINRIVSRYVFQRVKLILVREELSKQYLLGNGVDETKIHVTADPAFILPPAGKSRTEEILRMENISDIPTPIVGINPSGLISKYLNDPTKSEEHYIRSMAHTIDHLVETKGVSVILIPHVYSTKNDDRMAADKILKAVSNRNSVFQICGEYSASELKGIIGLCEIFVGARMHATIAATSLCIPTVGIAYSHKMHGIIGKTLGLEQYIIDIDKLDESILKTTIDAVWSDRTAIREHLKAVMPEVIEKAFKNGYYFSKFIESN